MIEQYKIGANVAHLWAPTAEIEIQSLQQIQNVVALPWVVHTAIMPDVHYGKGMTVGSVIAMRDACSPAAVGVDIGCGMLACKTTLDRGDLDGKLPALRAAIEERVPVGFNSHEYDHLYGLRQRDGELADAVVTHMAAFKDLDSRVQTLEKKAGTQIGTLGHGNHFIEICIDDSSGDCEDCNGSGYAPSGAQCGNCANGQVAAPSVWILLHSGSRNIGKELAEIHIAKARSLAHNAELPDPDLAVFLAGTSEMDAYRRDLYWAQEYARLNRLVMLDLIMQAIGKYFDDVEFKHPISCHHNYLAEEVHFGSNLFITRKGAISAQLGQFGIIPGSMGARSYIVRGLGNATSLNSASHGAGRAMSRTAAKKKFTVDDLERQTAGIECRKDIGVLDEIPGAYKPIATVIERQRDLVEVVTELRQVLCVKG